MLLTQVMVCSSQGCLKILRRQIVRSIHRYYLDNEDHNEEISINIPTKLHSHSLNFTYSTQSPEQSGLIFKNFASNFMTVVLNGPIDTKWAFGQVKIWCWHYTAIIMRAKHLKTPALRLFTQQLTQVQINENIKALRHWPLWGEFTGDQWFPPHKGPAMLKMFPFDDIIMRRANNPITWTIQCQAITWIKVDRNIHCHMASIGHNECNYVIISISNSLRLSDAYMRQ